MKYAIYDPQKDKLKKCFHDGKVCKVDNKHDSIVTILFAFFLLILTECDILWQILTNTAIFMYCDQVQAKCYHLLLSIFQHTNRALSTPYIHSLAPIMVEKLKGVENNRPNNKTELLAIQEGIKVLETLVALGEEQNSKYLD